MRELDAETRDRIAAGEVVTRPARVVAELVENSLDAGADRVTVEVDGDGTERIRVADDGRGMAPEEAPLAIERHTTTKIADVSDLEAVETLGFRGEALASIAAVSRLELETSDGGPRGTRVVVTDGEVTTEPVGRGRGTTVEVRDLFYNRPPRRESLAGANREFARISHLFAGYALVRPDVGFTLEHDGRETLSTPGTGSHVDALLGVYDRSVAGQSTALEAEATLEVDGATHTLALSGRLCYPSVTRAAPDHVTLAVNGRPVTNLPLRDAVRAGYGSLLPGDRHPVAVVAASLPPGLVDPNVHPAKERVALRASDAVADAVEAAVRDALSTADLRRTADVALDLDASVTPETGGSVLADATVIGQYRGLYLLCEADGDLLVVDQHAAHERVNYERLREAVEGEVPTATVDPPATLALSATEAATVEAERETLAALGFELESFGGTTYRVTGVPAPLGRVAAPESLRDLLDELRTGRSADTRNRLLADLACHPSLKAGDDLTDGEARRLLARLDACDRPFACPHGRPTVLSIDEATLVRGFEREGTRLG